MRQVYVNFSLIAGIIKASFLNASRADDHQPEHLAHLTKEIHFDRQMSTFYANECKNLLRNQTGHDRSYNWVAISDKFHKAEQLVPECEETDISDLRDLINNIIGSFKVNNLNLEIGVLGFGWRKDYPIIRDSYFEKRKRAVEGVRDGTKVSPVEILESLQTNGFEVDPRDYCMRMEDVATIISEAGYFEEARKLLETQCESPTTEQLAALVGYFSIGITESEGPRLMSQYAEVVNFAKDLQTSNPNNYTVMAAINSLYKRAQKFRDNRTLRDYTAADFDASIRLRARYSTAGTPELPTITSAELSEKFNSLIPSDKVEFKAYIDAIYRRQIQKNLMGYAYQLKARLYHEYYKSMDEPWLAYIWLQEALNSHVPREHKDVLNLKNLFEKGMFAELRRILGMDSHHQEGLLDQLVGQLSRNTGRTTFPAQEDRLMNAIEQLPRPTPNAQETLIKYKVKRQSELKSSYNPITRQNYNSRQEATNPTEKPLGLTSNAPEKLIKHEAGRQGGSYNPDTRKNNNSSSRESTNFMEQPPQPKTNEQENLAKHRIKKSGGSYNPSQETMNLNMSNLRETNANALHQRPSTRFEGNTPLPRPTGSTTTPKPPTRDTAERETPNMWRSLLKSTMDRKKLTIK